MQWTELDHDTLGQHHGRFQVLTRVKEGLHQTPVPTLAIGGVNGHDVEAVINQRVEDEVIIITGQEQPVVHLVITWIGRGLAGRSGSCRSGILPVTIPLGSEAEESRGRVAVKQ